MSQESRKKPNVYKVKTVKYVTFSSANVTVNLGKFLSTPEGKSVVKNAAKNIAGKTIVAKPGKSVAATKRDDTSIAERGFAA